MRVRSLDVLRGVAALTVAIPHYWMATRAAPDWVEGVSIASVEVFFVLSGFVLAPQILYCLERDFAARFRIFLLRRWIRTLPPFLVALTLVSILTGTLFSVPFFQYATFTYNWVHIDAAKDYFPVAWSLSIEEWFYIVFPIVLAIGVRAGVGLRWSVIAFMGAFLLLRASQAAEFGVDARRLVLFRLDSIAFGFVLFRLMSALRGRWTPRIMLVTVSGLVLSAAALAWLIGYLLMGPNLVAHMIYNYVAPLFAALLIFTVHSLDRRLSEKLAAKIPLMMGELSYDIYLFHIPIIILKTMLPRPNSPILDFGIYMVGLVGLSYFVRVLFERPLLAARPRYPDPGAGEFTADDTVAVHEADRPGLKAAVDDG